MVSKPKTTGTRSTKKPVKATASKPANPTNSSTARNKVSVKKASNPCSPWPQGEKVRRINVALQGGGAHGALTWGVLDRLLEDDGISIEGISGTSAGAVNGVLLAYGITAGGRAFTRDLLARFWKRISEIAATSPLQPTPLDRMLGLGRMDYSPAFMALDMMSRVLSPYQFNALALNPLRDTLAEFVDFEVIRHCKEVKLFVSATSVKRGRVKIFDLEEMSLDAVMASACLPFLQPAVEIDGEPYWDGGYMGNPAIFPLIYHTDSSDVLLIQLNPINIQETPKSAQEILDRLNTLTFNSSLMREMRAIKFVTDIIDSGYDDDGRLKRMLMHVIDAEDVMDDLGVSSKLNADWEFLQYLHRIGYDRTEVWLKENRDALGVRSTMDIEEMYL
ncbi:patatin-like phospholipase family protein [Denitrobaculum tricleocarpae]|uniref:Patatin-like phospholipase family protein n=1 Tax=Denitrobaculum tricleocarpae TaxID=2591009 RepID=A0A545TXX1_9PROT|nr:patatin-like phospholipase family protein [Denitrobaculum tricleocarpae]TQV82031.1 patatin-like phospholipase family protein [Denitrobaculum tricleocarpae]